MDRLGRTGMRWKVPGSQAMWNLRAIHQADRGREFHDFLALANRQKTRDLRHCNRSQAIR
jgi:hypothetical protein